MTDIERLRDTLDHIMRVAREGVTPTRRLDWIALRAKYALEGKEWSRDVRESPRNRVLQMLKKNASLRAELADLKHDIARHIQNGGRTPKVRKPRKAKEVAHD